MEEEQASKTLGQLQTAGVALMGLEVAERRSGLGGRTLLTLAIASVRGGGLLPPHRLHAGDLVALRPSGSKGAVAGVVAGTGDTSETRGTVYRVYEAQIVVAMEDDQVRIRLMAPPHAAEQTVLGRSAPCGALCPVPCALCPVPCALCPVPCARCTVPCALCPVPCALCPVPCALCPVPCALCPVPCAPRLWLSAGVCTRRKSCRQARCAW
jgi:hypothetical protein